MNLKVGEWHTIKVNRYISQLQALKSTVSFGNQALGEDQNIFDS